jgi:hypothetical protein
MQWDSPIKIKGFPGRSLRGCGGLVSSYPTEPGDRLIKTLVTWHRLNQVF